MMRRAFITDGEFANHDIPHTHVLLQSAGCAEIDKPVNAQCCQFFEGHHGGRSAKPRHSQNQDPCILAGRQVGALQPPVALDISRTTTNPLPEFRVVAKSLIISVVNLRFNTSTKRKRVYWPERFTRLRFVLVMI